MRLPQRPAPDYHSAPRSLTPRRTSRATATVQATAVQPSAKQTFLDSYEREHATTMKVLRAFPPDKADLRPHPKCKSARELAWIFVLERGLGALVMNDRLSEMTGGSPEPPARFEDV